MDARLEARLKPGTDYHPLQVIPFFRRWKPSTLRNFVFTAILCAIIVAVFGLFNLALGHRLSWQRVYEIATFAFAIGYSQHYCYQTVITSARNHPTWAGSLMHPISLGLVVPVVAIYIGSNIAMMLLTGGRGFAFAEGWREFVFSALIAILVGWTLWDMVEKNRLKEIEKRERAELEASLARADRERATAELKTLRAQVEPHFLYNTLSNVVSLIDREPATAKHMTERLIGYLRHTLDASRRDHATVGDELAIIADYLEILRLRMGERLAFSIDADDAVRALPLSPMLLQPLVENAIKHGLEPKIEGGRIAVSASVTDDLLEILVEDSGLGFGVATDTTGSGSGLANVRARLKALYGDSAKLTIEQPKEGTRIRITLPIATEM